MRNANPDRREASGEKSRCWNGLLRADVAKVETPIFFITVALVNYHQLHQLHDQLPHPQIDLLTRVSPTLFLLLNNIQALLIMYWNGYWGFHAALDFKWNSARLPRWMKHQTKHKLGHGGPCFRRCRSVSAFNPILDVSNDLPLPWRPGFSIVGLQSHLHRLN
jgi:hypothetical protein